MGTRAPLVLLDDARVAGAADAHLFEDPAEVFVARTPAEVAGVLAAFALVREAMPAAHLLLIGEGPSRAALESAAAALGLRDAVTFAGHLDGDTNLHGLGDLSVLSSRSEGFPNAIVEAMAAARKIAEKSQISVKAAKESVNRAYETSMTEGILFERRNFQALFSTEDQKEGMAAFLEKREAQFRDR